MDWTTGLGYWTGLLDWTILANLATTSLGKAIFGAKLVMASLMSRSLVRQRQHTMLHASMQRAIDVELC